MYGIAEFVQNFVLVTALNVVRHKQKTLSQNLTHIFIWNLSEKAYADLERIHIK